MQTRSRIDYGANDFRQQGPGQVIMSQLTTEANTTVGAGTWTATSMLGGIINRSGPVGGYTDTTPTVNQLLAACPQLSVGDSFTVLFQNTVAQAMTLAAGVGFTLGANVNTAASLVREYIVQMTSTKSTAIVQGATTNASAIVTGVAVSDLVNLGVGQVITATGVTAGTTIIGINLNNGTFTMSAAATATSTGNVALQCDPTATITGVRSSTL